MTLVSSPLDSVRGRFGVLGRVGLALAPDRVHSPVLPPDWRPRLTHAEAALITVLLNQGDVLQAEALGLTESHFHTFRPEYEWLTSYRLKYRSDPSITAFRTAFPDFFVDTIDSNDMEYLTDRVRTNHVKVSTARLLRDQAQALAGGTDPVEVLTALHSHVTKINSGIDTAIAVSDSLTDYSDALDQSLSYSQDGVPANRVPMSHPTLQERTFGLGEGDLCVKAARLSMGKALRNGTGVLTSKGYVPIESLVVGNKVTGANGKPTKVIGVYPQGQKQVLEVEFSDGSVIETCEEHLWTVRLGSKPWKVMTTGQIAKRSGQALAVPMMAPTHFAESGYLYDSYKLGLLLGDGCFRGNGTVSFTTADQELVDVWGKTATKWSGSPYDYGIAGLVPTMKKLGLYGTTSRTKFVPKAYLWSSAPSRLALLQGILDTDGSVTCTGGIEYFSMSEQLARGVQHLAESLGGYAHWHESKGGYRLIIVLPNGVQPFRLARKAALYKGRCAKRQPVRTIREVRYTGRYEDMTCIAVEAPDSLFVTEHCIVTHNTWDLVNDGTTALLAGKRVLFFSLEMNRIQMQYRFQTLLAQAVHHPVSHRGISRGSGDMLAYKATLNLLSDKKVVPGELLIHDTTRGIVTPLTVAAAINKHHPDLVIVDYLQLLSGSGASGRSADWQSVSEIVGQLKTVATQFSTPILTASQINREGDNAGWRPPKSKHLALSDSIGQDADYVITMKRYGAKTMVYSLEKNRHGQAGDLWWAEFDVDNGRMAEITRDQADAINEREGEFRED